MSGGEIYWDCIGPNQYRITMVIYRDCFGINVDPAYNLQLTSPCGNRNLTVTTPGGTEISQLCDLVLPNSTCNGGNLPGIQQYIYTGVITLPPCDSWTISYTNIFRNAAIVNLINPGQQRTYIRARMNTAASPCNDSPQFTNTAIPYVCAGFPISYSFGAYDPEADSLTYQLISAMGIAGAPLGYVAPHTGTQPIPGLTLDPLTGLVNFTLNTIGNWVVVVQVNHWVNGQLVGHIIRDMQFVAYPCNNIPPDPTTGVVEGLNGAATQTGPRAIQVCESGSFCFNMVISDPNTNNVLTAFSNVSQNLPGSTFSYTGTNPITATVCWNAQPGTSGFYPFIVNVNDGACPIPAFQTYVYAIRVLPGLGATLEVVDESCLDAGNGSITAVVNAGTAPFTYAWSTGSTEASITGGPGDYSVVVEDVNGCISPPLQASIGTAAFPSTANAGPDQGACVGQPISLTGTVQNAAGGQWSGGTGTFNGTGLNVTYTPSTADLQAGGVTLTLTTTGNTGCPPASDQVFIALTNSFANAAVSSTNATCAELSNGSATFSPSQPGFTYLWSDPAAQTTATATGLAAGSYTVTVTDALGCSITLPTAIGPQQPVTISNVTVTPETCAGDGDGTATVSATGGTAPYTYSWSIGVPGPSIVAGSGTYMVSITDANGCAPVLAEVTIGVQGFPNQANAGPDQAVCLGAFPVSLSGQVTNATGAVWSGGTGTLTSNGASAQYTPTMAEIMAGSVDLTLTTTGNTACAPASDVVTINFSNSFLQTQMNVVHATCSDAFNGSASVTPALPGLNFLWSTTPPQNGPTAFGLGAGTYTVTVTDALGCDTALQAVIGPPGPVVLTSLTATDETCLNAGNGGAGAVAAGGTAPYSFLWNTGETTPNITAPSGTYSVTVTDANGCTPALGTVVIGTQALPNEANTGPDLIGCLNSLPLQLNGAVTNASGGSWSGGTGIFLGSGLNAQYMPSSAEIQAGGTTLVLSTTGNSLCPVATDTLNILLSNSFLNASVSSTAVLCHGDANGSASFTPQLPGHTYTWSIPAAGNVGSLSGLSAGAYSVLVTDILGCDTTLNITITQPDPLTAQQGPVTAVTCAGGSNGSAQLTVSGGTTPYAITWSNGATGTAAIGLTAGNYSAQVQDANGCSTSITQTVPEPAPLGLTASIPDTVCVNAFVELSAEATGGTGALTVSWAGLGTGNMISTQFNTSTLVTVTVTDAAGCPGPVIDRQVHVLDLGSATLLTYGDTTVCPGGQGTVGATLTGYAGNYLMVWPQLGAFGNGPFTVPIVADIDLVVQVTDACQSALNGVVALRLDEPPTFQLPVVIAEGCAPLTVQMPDLQLPAGTSYTWQLGNGQTSTAASPTITYGPGNYAITLTASTPLGCTMGQSSAGSVIVHALPTAAFTASTWDTDAANATITFTDQSTGTGLTHDWLFGDGGTSTATNPVHSYSDVGTFDVELWVTDNHGCEAYVSHPVTIRPVYDITFPTAFTPNPNGGNGGSWDPNDLSNDVFYPFARFVEDLRIRIFNRWGELVFESNELGRGWDGYYRGQLSPQDVYVVQAWFRFVDGKEINKLSDLTLFR